MSLYMDDFDKKWEEFEASCRSCEACDLCKNRTNVVIYRGSRNFDLCRWLDCPSGTLLIPPA